MFTPPRFRILSINRGDGATIVPAESGADWLGAIGYAGRLICEDVVLVQAEEHAAMVANQREPEPATAEPEWESAPPALEPVRAIFSTRLALIGAFADRHQLSYFSFTSFQSDATPEITVSWDDFRRICAGLTATVKGPRGLWRIEREGIRLQVFGDANLSDGEHVVPDGAGSAVPVEF